MGGVRDLAHNGAHIKNPPVLVKGSRPPKHNMDLSVENGLVTFNPELMTEVPEGVSGLAVISTSASGVVTDLLSR